MPSLNGERRQGDRGASIGILRSFKPFFGLALSSIQRRVKRIKSSPERLASRRWRPIVSRLNRRRQLSHEIDQKHLRPGTVSIKKPEARRDLGWRRLDMVLPSGVALHPVSLKPELGMPAGQIFQSLRSAEPESPRRLPAFPEGRVEPPATFRKPEPRARLYSKIEEIPKEEIDHRKPVPAKDQVEERFLKPSPEIQPPAEPKPAARDVVQPVPPPESFPPIGARPAVSRESAFSDRELEKPLIQRRPASDDEGLLPARKSKPGLGDDAAQVSDEPQRQPPVVSRRFKPISQDKSKQVQRSTRPVLKTVHKRIRRKPSPEPASTLVDAVVQKETGLIRQDRLQKRASRQPLPAPLVPPIRQTVVKKDGLPVERRIQKVSDKLELIPLRSKASLEQLRTPPAAGIQRMPLGAAELSRKTHEGLGKQALPGVEQPEAKEKLPSAKELAQMVYPLIKRMLAVEKERSSGRPF